MANIIRIDVHVTTGTAGGAGTDGEVYIGIAGREFYIDIAYDDFEQGSDRIYILGDGANIRYEDYNDPCNPQLDTADVDRFPVYLRFEPRGDDANWNLDYIKVTINPGPRTQADRVPYPKRWSNALAGSKIWQICLSQKTLIKAEESSDKGLPLWIAAKQNGRLTRGCRFRYASSKSPSATSATPETLSAIQHVSKTDWMQQDHIRLEGGCYA
jgi:hypothetical protein